MREDVTALTDFWKRYKPAIIVLALFFLYIVVPSSASVFVPDTAYFGIPEYSTYINFNSQQTFGAVYREDSYWYFNDYGFQVQNANITISSFFENNHLIFTVSAPSGTSTSKVYVDNLGHPTSIKGATSYHYDSETKILTLTVSHSSNVEIDVSWSSSIPGEVVESYWVIFQVSFVFLAVAVLATAGGAIMLIVSGGGEGGAESVAIVVFLSFAAIIAALIVMLTFQAVT